MKENRDELIIQNMPLVTHIVKLYLNCGIEYDDLIQIGTIGLIKGIDKYDESKGYTLSTFCGTVIKNEILGNIRRQRNGPTFVISMETPINSEDQNCTIGESIQDPIDYESDIIDRLHTDQIMRIVNEELSKLSERNQYIIRHRYCLDGCEKIKLDRLAKIVGLSRNSVCQIINGFTKKIKKRLSSLEN